MKLVVRLMLWAGAVLVAGGASGAASTEAYKTAIEADWSAQEKRLGREAGQSETIRTALERAGKLLTNSPDGPRLRQSMEALERFRTEASPDRLVEPGAGLALYHRVRWLARDLALSHPQMPRQPLALRWERLVRTPPWTLPTSS